MKTFPALYSRQEGTQPAGIPTGYAEAVIGGIDKGLLLVSTDCDRKILTANPAFLRRFNLSTEETIGRPLFDILSSDGLDEKIREVCETGKPKQFVSFKIGITTGSSEASFRVSITNVGLPDQDGILLLMEDVADEERPGSQVRYLTDCDPLTGLVNRAWFMDRLKQDLDEARLSESRLVLLVVDLNRFVEIRNSAGKATGDLILAEVARRLRKMLRAGDVVARLGVGTFVIMANVSDAVAVGIAERVCAAMASPIRIGAYSVAITANVGISSFPEDGTSPNSLLENAALAAFRMKVEGGGYRFYRQERATQEHYAQQDGQGQQAQTMVMEC